MITSYHLSNEERIKLGSYYTPEKLISKTFEILKPFIKDNGVFFDNQGGFGLFVEPIKNDYDYRIQEIDKIQVEYLKEHFDENKIFHTNSLINVDRQRFNIKDDDYLIIIGNPPYNNLTSEYKKEKRGSIECDKDIKSTDLGISFLRSYNKLKQDIVGILHPLSYLIKKNNFNQLKEFKNNYKLVRGVIFSSGYFKYTNSQKFPIIIQIYIRNKDGMSFDYIKNFKFEILDDSDKFFKLNNFQFIDDYVRKYQPKKNEDKISDIGIYFYPLRDINQLKRNKTFIINGNGNKHIKVMLNNFYKYQYIDTFKKLFNPKDMWLYGNISPFMDKKFIENHKKEFVIYSLQTNKELINKLDKENKRKIMEYYNIKENDFNDLNKLTLMIQQHIEDLINRQLNCYN